jgi:nitrogen-specific signal transduction histidine kinase
MRQLEMVNVEIEMAGSMNGNQDFYKKLMGRVDAAIADAERGTEFAKSVLNHTRPGRVGFEVQDISKAVEVGLKLVYMKHRDFKTIMLEQDIEEGLPHTWANITSIQNMFQITVDNAYDAIMSKKDKEPDLQGKITIRIKHKKIQNIIRIEIEDNGLGMKPNILKSVRAQVPHVTTKGSTSEKSGFGAGVNFLGKLVTMHRGKLDFKSEYMVGTTTVIDIPVIGKPNEKELEDDKAKNYAG